MVVRSTEVPWAAEYQLPGFEDVEDDQDGEKTEDETSACETVAEVARPCEEASAHQRPEGDDENGERNCTA